VVLSRAVENHSALTALISKLRHHISVLSKRLHLATREKAIIRHIVCWTKCPNCLTDCREPSADVVAVEVEIVDIVQMESNRVL